MELVKYNFNIKDLPNGVFTIIPIGDLQYDGSQESTALRLLKETIDRGVGQDAYYIGMGDYTDFLSPSNRKRLKGADLYDTANDVIERAGETLIDEIYDILRPTQGRWLGMLEGHHFQEFADGSTSDMKLAERLNARNLGTSAFIGLVFERDNGSSILVNIWASHGCGGGMGSGSPLRKLDSVVPSYEADIYLLGHMTKMAHAPVNRIYPTWGGVPDVRHRDLHLVGTGGFSRAIQIGKRAGKAPRGSYVEAAMMRPASLGAPTIRITPQRLRADHQDVLTRRITTEL